MLYITESYGKGRGVFTDKKISRGGVIERCPILEIPSGDLAMMTSTVLNNYYFCWGKNQGQGALALGLGSLYNHSYTPNAVYIPKPEEKVIEFVSIKNILANDEVTINYNGTPNDQSPLWSCDTIDWRK